jgi:hypothetical protein
MDMPNPEDQDIETLHEEFLLNYLPSNFPEEFRQLCLLPPLHGNEDLIRTVKINVGAIVLRHRTRFTEDMDYFVRIKQCIRSAESAEKAIEEFVNLFMNMDTDHRDATLNVANEIAPHRFPDQKLGEFLGKLTTMATTMKVLAAAVTLGTGISAAKRGQGRPWSPYISPARELTREWESITAEPMTTGEALTFFGPIDNLTPAQRRAIRRINTPFDGLKIKPVPTPRPLGKGKDKDQKRQYVEHSTEFIGLCLKMIKPDITPQQVITSIKHAVKLRAVMEQMVENAAAGKSPLLALMDAMAEK